MKARDKTFSFLRIYSSLAEVLIDKKLAALGDSFVNFAYSLALSERKGTPEGKKVKGTLLAEALRRAGLREHLPSRMTSHMLADAAEALIVYAWLKDLITLGETVAIIRKCSDPVEGLSQLLERVKDRIKLS